jgi:glycosyltransferase involved in cell wall biosynthesis
MKVLMLTTNLDLPEANLMVGLEKLGVEIKLVMHKDSPFQNILQGSGISLEYWNFKSRIDFKAILFLRKLLSKERYDIIHTFSARSLTSALLASLFRPVKHVTYRGTTGHLSRLDPSSWLSYFSPKISKIICVSDAVKKYLVDQGISENKLTRIYKGHKENWYKKDLTVSRKDFDISPETFLVACSANMRHVKGVDLLIEAFNFIPAELDIKVVLIGEVRDPVINNLLSNPRLKTRLVLCGFRRDAAGIVGFCDAFCMPSRKREGLPKALIEAMIQSKAAIVTKVGGMPELVQDGKEGLVVEEENSEAIAKAILKLHADRDYCKKLGSAAREKIVNEFTIENTINQTFNIYKSVATSVDP